MFICLQSKYVITLHYGEITKLNIVTFSTKYLFTAEARSYPEKASFVLFFFFFISPSNLFYSVYPGDTFLRKGLLWSSLQRTKTSLFSFWRVESEGKGKTCFTEKTQGKKAKDKPTKIPQKRGKDDGTFNFSPNDFEVPTSHRQPLLFQLPPKSPGVISHRGGEQGKRGY